MGLKFFDVVEGRGVFTAADKYFILPKTSNYLGHQVYRINTQKQGLENVQVAPSWNRTCKHLLMALKVASLFTVAIPATFLMIKKIGRCRLKAKITTPVEKTSQPQPTNNGRAESTERQQGRQYWENIWTEERKKQCDPLVIDKSERNRRLELIQAGLKQGIPRLTIAPFIEEFEKIPRDELKGCFDPRCLDWSNDADQLIKDIQEGLAAGYPVVSGTIGWGMHQRCYAVSSSGEVQIIDSMTYDNKDKLREIVQKLNDTKIRNPEGKVITFSKNEAISTGLQKDWHNCTRFAMLYAYAIATSGEINGWQRVHGALLDGQLKSVDDLNHLKEARCVSEIHNQNESLYEPIMASLCYRFAGYPVKDWEEIEIYDFRIIENTLMESTAAIHLCGDKWRPSRRANSKDMAIYYKDGSSEGPYRQHPQCKIEPVVDENLIFADIAVNPGEAVYLIEQNVGGIKKKSILRYPESVQLIQKFL